VIRALPPDPLTLEALLRGVTDQNLHCEWDTGPAVGKEVWSGRDQRFGHEGQDKWEHTRTGTS
jgi:hypothetical protein